MILRSRLEANIKYVVTSYSAIKMGFLGKTAQRTTHAKQKKAEITFAAVDYCHIVRTVQFCCRLDLPAQLKLLLSFQSY